MPTQKFPFQGNFPVLAKIGLKWAKKMTKFRFQHYLLPVLGSIFPILDHSAFLRKIRPKLKNCHLLKDFFPFLSEMGKLIKQNI